MNAIEYLQKTFLFGPDSVVGAILPEPKKQKSISKSNENTKKIKSRHVVWDPEAEGYTLLRKGIPIENELVLEELYGANKIDESYFFIFKNNDPNLERNKTVPLYEAGYFCTDTAYFLRVQKCHLKQGYVNSNRTENEKMWTLEEDNSLPYWVDRYVFCKTGQYKSKSKYESKNKK